MRSAAAASPRHAPRGEGGKGEAVRGDAGSRHAAGRTRARAAAARGAVGAVRGFAPLQRPPGGRFPRPSSPRCSPAKARRCKGSLRHRSRAYWPPCGVRAAGHSRCPGRDAAQPPSAHAAAPSLSPSPSPRSGQAAPLPCAGVWRPPSAPPRRPEGAQGTAPCLPRTDFRSRERPRLGSPRPTNTAERGGTERKTSPPHIKKRQMIRNMAPSWSCKRAYGAWARIRPAIADPVTCYCPLIYASAVTLARNLSREIGGASALRI